MVWNTLNFFWFEFSFKPKGDIEWNKLIKETRFIKSPANNLKNYSFAHKNPANYLIPN